jgi:FKBP-type peptidyl-prolyl cis-trans isomerase
VARQQKKKKKKGFLPIFVGVAGIGLIAYMLFGKKRVTVAAGAGGDASGAQAFGPGGQALPAGAGWEDVDLPSGASATQAEALRQRLLQQQQAAALKQQQLLQQQQQQAAAQKAAQEAAAQAAAQAAAEAAAQEEAAAQPAGDEEFQDIAIKPAESTTTTTTTQPVISPVTQTTLPMTPTYEPPAGEHEWGTVRRHQAFYQGAKFNPNRVVYSMQKKGRTTVVKVTLPDHSWIVIPADSRGWYIAGQSQLVAGLGRAGNRGNIAPQGSKKYKQDVAHRVAFGEPLQNGQRETLEKMLGL